MPASLVIATILVTGWNLVLLTTILFTDPQLLGAAQTRSKTMSRSYRLVRAEVGKPEIDARTTAWKRDHGRSTTESAASRVTETEREATMSVPYAEASVTVVGDDGDELRHCSVCMN